MSQSTKTDQTKPTGRIELFDGNGQRKYLTGDERQRFHDAARKQPSYEVMTFCLFLYWTGCRISEALAILRSRVDFESKAVTIESLKKRRKGVFRQVPLPEAFLRELDQVHRLKKPKRGEKRQDWLLWEWSRRTATRRVEEVMAAAGIDGIQATAKGLRHAFAIECLQKGIPLNLASKWLGHASLTTTAIYANALGEEERTIAARLWNK
jgi:integrase/recombinase XerD